MFVYRNSNTGDVVEYEHRSARLEILPNWETLQDPETEQEPPHAPPDPEAPEVPQTPPEPTAGPGTQEPPGPSGPVAGGDSSGPDAIKRPARSASKADWQAYARTRAQDSDEEAAVDGLTRDQLAEQYGGDS